MQEFDADVVDIIPKMVFYKGFNTVFYISILL
jgi:hypothetical protein